MFLTNFEFPVAAGIFFGLIFFLSWVGYGYLLAKLLRPPVSPSIGLLACLGISVIVFIGGIQSLLGIVSETKNLIIILIGVFFFFLWLKDTAATRSLYIKGNLKKFSTNTGYSFLVILVRILSVGILAVHAIASFFPFWIDECDDWVSYFHFPKLLLDTGTLIEPFNLRRMATLGGAQYLQSFLYPIFGISALPFIDVGMGLALVWLLAVTFAPSRGQGSIINRLIRECLGLTALLLAATFFLLNHCPVYLPYALFVCFLFLLFDMEVSGTPGWPEIIVLAFVASAVVSIRNNFLVFVIISLFLRFAFCCSEKGIAKKIRGFIQFSIVLLFLLAPWMALSFKSNATPFFPIFKGFYNFPSGLSQPMAVFEKIDFLVDILLASKSVILPAFVIISILSNRTSIPILLIAISTIASVIIISFSLTASDSYNITRYCQPFLVASLFVSLVMLSQEDAAPLGRGNIFFKSAILFAILWWTFWPTEMSFFGEKVQIKNSQLLLSHNKDFFQAARDLPSYIHKEKIEPVELELDFYSASTKNSDISIELANPYRSASYQQVEEFIPEKAKILSVTAQPFYWDFKKHNIHTLDCIGQVSPPPGLPFFKGADALVDYFDRLGYQYIVYTPSQSPNCYYYEKKWVLNLKHPMFILREWAPYFLDFFKNIKVIEARGAVVFQNSKLKVIDLRLAHRNPYR
ncbi:MAG: hypothetical protein Q7T53_08365 [Deltaproteobacteria bacterium]|nr:hypothetical protein [Deltaproteobacteria bacterium]